MDYASETTTVAGANPWAQDYVYDRVGNRALTSSSYQLPGNQAVVVAAATEADVATVFPSNRASGMNYDNAGNVVQTSLPTSHQFEYDAESRMKKATIPGSPSVVTTYDYDGEGRRVKSTVGGVQTVFVYDAMGRLAQEYGAAGPQTQTQYLTQDALGSTRLVSDAGGVEQKCYDYLPFGEQVIGGQAGRTATCFAGGQYPQAFDGVRAKFTGKERDAETGLDYFGARYFSGAQGRFTSPDPMLNSAKPWDPQSWNRYSYALNNPLKFVDPNGLYNLVNTCAEDDKKCNNQFEQNAANLKRGLTDLQKRVDKMKAGTEKDRLQAALGAMGTESDKNNVNVQFGPTGDGAAAQTNPLYNEQTGKLGFNVIFDPKHITGGTNDWAIDAAHEGTHVADISDPRFNNPATTLSPFSLEYRGYTTSAWAASALGLPSLSYGNGRYQIWNPSWGQVDKTLTNYITSMKDKQGRQNHPETIPHNPWGN